jgi:putative hydrolase of the HAD superfamily
MELMARNPEVAVASRAVSCGHKYRCWERNRFIPDYSIFEGPHAANPHMLFQEALAENRSVLMIKEETGDNLARGSKYLNECNFPILPNRKAVEESFPIFGIREPVRNFDGWKKRGWTDLASFLAAYDNILASYDWARTINPDILCITYESLVRSRQAREAILRECCNQWGLTFHAHMLDPAPEFASNFVFWDDRERDIYLKRNPLGLFSELRKTRQVAPDLPAYGMVTTEERRIIEKRLVPSYEAIQSDLERRLGRNTAERRKTRSSSLDQGVSR